MKKVRWIVGVVFVTGVVGLVVGLATRDDTSSQAATPASVSHVNWQQNGVKGPRFVELVQGRVIDTIGGTVRTDTDCAADQSGLSHCHNVIVLDNQKNITVIDIHNMSRSACLKPGERVVVRPVSPTWASVTT